MRQKIHVEQLKDTELMAEKIEKMKKCEMKDKIRTEEAVNDKQP